MERWCDASGGSGALRTEIFQAAQVGVTRQIDNLRADCVIATGSQWIAAGGRTSGRRGPRAGALPGYFLWSGQLGDYRAGTWAWCRCARLPVTKGGWLHGRMPSTRCSCTYAVKAALLHARLDRGRDGKQAEYWLDPSARSAGVLRPSVPTGGRGDLRRRYGDRSNDRRRRTLDAAGAYGRRAVHALGDALPGLTAGSPTTPTAPTRARLASRT